MRSTNRTMLALLILVALAGIVSAEDVTITYTHSATGTVVYEVTTSTSISDITLPATLFDVSFANVEGTFTVTAPQLNVSEFPVLDVNVSDVDENTVDNGALGIGERYEPRNAYAFQINNDTGLNYTITFDYTGFSTSKLRIYQFGYNFTTDIINYSDEMLFTSPTINTSAKTASIEVQNFSLFVLAEDTKKTTSGSPGGGSGGSGGGSGGSYTDTIDVVPLPNGTTIELRRRQKANIFLGSVAYQYTLSTLFPVGVSMKGQVLDSIGLIIGIPKDVDLNGDGRADVKIILSKVKSSSAIMTFISLAAPTPTLPPVIVPSEATTEAPSAPELTPSAPTEAPSPTTPTPTPSPPSPIQPVVEEPGFNILTVIIPLVLIIVLIGSVAVLRRKLAMDKPPTAVTGSGPDSTELPPTTDQSEPVTPFSPEKEKKEEEEFKEAITTVEEKPKERKPETVDYRTPSERLKEVEKYIYHGLAYGFSEEQLRDMLASKGWPVESITSIFNHIHFVDLHVHDEKLHKEDIAVEHAVSAVQRLLGKGISEEQLKQGLLRKGWSKSMVERILRSAKK